MSETIAGVAWTPRGPLGKCKRKYWSGKVTLNTYIAGLRQMMDVLGEDWDSQGWICDVPGPIRSTWLDQLPVATL